MPPKSEPASPSLVDSIRPLLRIRKAKVSVGELLDRMQGADGPGPLLFALTLPVLLPLPPGFSMVLSLPLLMVAPQIMIGRRRVWLPKALSRRSIKRQDLVKVLRRVLPLLERFEKMARPRLRFLTGPVGSPMVGLACTALAIVLVLPIPFANLVPSLALSLFSMGLTRRDGVLVLGGYGLMGLAALIIALGVHGVSVGLSHWRATH